MVTKELTEGTTAAQDFRLRYKTTAGEWAVFDGTGMDVELVLYDRTGVQIDTTANVDWQDAPDGVVRYLPDALDLTVIRSPYEARFWVTDSQNKLQPFPDGRADRWVVRR